MSDYQTLQEEVFTGKIDYALWRKILVFARPYTKHFVGLGALGGIIAVYETALPIITGKVIDALRAHQQDHTPMHMLPYAIAYGVTVLLFAICIWGFIRVAGTISNWLSHDIRKAGFEKLQELPFSFYDRRAVGWLMARLTSDCGRLSGTIAWALLDIVWGSIVVTMIVAAMFWLNWKVALCVMVIVPFLILASRFFQVRLLLTNRALRKANSQTTAAYNEAIVGVRTTKTMSRESENLREFSSLTDQMYGHAYQAGLYEAMFLPVILSLVSVGIGLALWRGGVQVTLLGLSVGKLVTFIQYASFLQHPAQEVANAITRVQGAQASAERVQSLLDEEPDIKDSPQVVEAIAKRTPRDGTAIDGGPNRIETIEFRDVSFAYKAGQTVLRHFNLTVRAGQTIALVGPTGGGKSTIVGLACRFYEPTSGQILINGTDYRQRSLKWLQGNLGMVLQQPHLFAGSVRENIRFGKLDATDAEIEQAAKLTNAHDFILQLEKGYDTPVGEGGNKLSTGQKQLIALARAIIAEPQIFVMDEATSSVDTQTEKLIQDAVERVLEGRISFVIAHRLSTIKSADQIVVIRHGEIAESGTHHELLARRGRYFELYTNQFTQEREDQMLNYQTVEAE